MQNNIYYFLNYFYYFFKINIFSKNTVLVLSLIHFILASMLKSHVWSRRRRPIPFIDIRPNVAVLGGWRSILGRRSIAFISFLRLFFEAPTTTTPTASMTWRRTVLWKWKNNKILIVWLWTGGSGYARSQVLVSYWPKCWGLRNINNRQKCTKNFFINNH